MEDLPEGIPQFLYDNMDRLSDIKMRSILRVKKYITISLTEFMNDYCDYNELNYGVFTGRASTNLSLKRKFDGKGDPESLGSVSYFYMNDSSICIEFLIKTHYGYYTIPVIGMKHIRAKEKRKKELIELPKFKKEREKLCYMYFLYYTELPVEMIHYIMDFY